MDSLVTPRNFEEFKVLSEEALAKIPKISVSKVAKIPNKYQHSDLNTSKGTDMPVLDHFVVEYNKKFSENVRIRSWRYDKGQNGNGCFVYYTVSCSEILIIFSKKFKLANCRYCHKVKREHKSNNVYYVANLGRGKLYQKCFNCPEYSWSVTLPLYVKKEICKKIDNIEFFET